MIYIAADHNGYKLKEQLKQFLGLKKIRYLDLGPQRFVKRYDYPDFAVAVARRVKGQDQGLLICGSGHGMAIAANKIRGIRAALCTTPFSAKMARHDDHANVLVLASWETSPAKAKKIISVWLKTKASTVARHVRRVKKINRIDT